MRLFLVNVLLAVLWIFLWGELSFYTLLVGFAGGYLVLWLFTRTHGGMLRDAYGQRIVDLLRFSGHFLVLLVQSNLQIAREILTPGLAMQPRFVRYEVTGLNPVQITALSNAITLTPGTLVIDVRDTPDGRTMLYVHCMFAKDRQAAVDDLDALRQRMEQDLFKTLPRSTPGQPEEAQR